MRFTDILTTALAAESQTPTIFPFSFQFHLGLAIIGFLFFIISFFKMRRPYQLLFAVGIPLSLLIWLAEDNRSFYYGIGILELVIILGALVTSILTKPKKEEKAEAAPAAEAEDTEE